MIHLSRISAEPSYRKWADQKLEFAWKCTTNPKLPLLGSVLSNTGVDRRVRNADTDSFYFLRDLFDIYQLTHDDKYRDWALATTDLWYQKAWDPDFRQFVGRLDRQGEAEVKDLYGDGKYNFLHLMIAAYRATKDRKYLQRFADSWASMRSEALGGLIPSRFIAGKADKKLGPDPMQTVFIEILLNAFEATRDRGWLKEAQRFGSIVLAAGKPVWRLGSGQAGTAFLRLGLQLRDAGPG